MATRKIKRERKTHKAGGIRGVHTFRRKWLEAEPSNVNMMSPSRGMPSRSMMMSPSRPMPSRSMMMSHSRRMPSRGPNIPMMVSPNLRRSVRSRKAPLLAPGMMTHAEFKDEQKKVEREIKKLRREKRDLHKNGKPTDEIDMKIDELTEMFGALLK